MGIFLGFCLNTGCAGYPLLFLSTFSNEYTQPDPDTQCKKGTTSSA